MERGLGPQVNEQIRALMNTDIAAAVTEIRQHLEHRENIRLNIAVTGETGSGKSTFVNTFSQMANVNERAAPTGAIETTMELRSYPHPKHPNVLLWDLPGIGTTNFPRDNYIQQTGFKDFDSFIIISDTRLRENDVKLAQEIRRMGKMFYFVRTKVDSELHDEEKRNRDFNAERTLEQIKEHCIQDLREQGFGDTQTFLLCSFELELYDFPLLYENFTRELPELKRHALLMEMLNIYLGVSKRKKETFKSNIKYYAALSAAGAAVPLPGLSVAVDLSLIVNVVKEYVAGFGLDGPSLQRLAASSGVPFDELTFNIRSVLANTEITTHLILTLLTQLASTSALLVAEEWTRFIPVFGIPAAMGLSSLATYRALSFFLNELADEAQRVFKRALRINIE